LGRYVVEKILGHRFNKGVLEFDVKWQGYDNPEDRTWEPEENMYAHRANSLRLR
jgi:chromobox protein 1